MTYKKIIVRINGKDEFSTTSYPNCEAVIAHIRAAKHIEIPSTPRNRYLTVYDYDTLSARYAK